VSTSLKSAPAFPFEERPEGNGSIPARGAGGARMEYRRFMRFSTLDLSLGRTRGGGGMGCARPSAAGRSDCRRGSDWAPRLFCRSEFAVAMMRSPHTSLDVGRRSPLESYLIGGHVRSLDFGILEKFPTPIDAGHLLVSQSLQRARLGSTAITCTMVELKQLKEVPHVARRPF
jgi:hypothetical protein